ncbi:MAG: hypothetical protein AB8G99_05245 [Planctomycetaceae bacterium]
MSARWIGVSIGPIDSHERQPPPNPPFVESGLVHPEAAAVINTPDSSSRIVRVMFASLRKILRTSVLHLGTSDPSWQQPGYLQFAGTHLSASK